MILNTKKNLAFFFFTCFLFFGATNTNAQKLKILIENGDKAFADNDFFGAALYYNQAILKDSIDLSILYKYAEASRLNYDYNIADKWYNKVYNEDKQGEVFPECVFWIATIKKSKGEYKEAKKFFLKYNQKNKKKKDNYFVKKAIQEAAACDYAQWLVTNPDKSINVVHLDSAINSKVSEYAPFQVDSILYFSSLRNASDSDIKNSVNYNKIYTAIEEKNKWKQSTELDTLFNERGTHNANTAFNADKTKMYITRCKQQNALDFICEIYSSEKKDSCWTPLQKLPPNINLEGYTNTQPTIGYLGDEEVLFFSSNRPKGEGKMDIWYSKIKSDSTYETPINAGKKVNTIEDEITPFYCKPCQELFFSSTWHKGLGGFDIFKSNYTPKGFDEPKNLGLPINSSYNDIYFSINTQKTASFLSSNRLGSYFEEKETCCNDIYMFKIPIDSAALVLKDSLKDSLSGGSVTKLKGGATKTANQTDSTQFFITQIKSYVPLTLYFHNDEPNKKTVDTITKKNYRTTYEEYSALREQYKKEFSKGMKTKQSIRAQEKIELFFEDYVDGGMEDLEEFSKLMLKILNAGGSITITMKGYCSPLASTNYNINLAKRRISSLKNYFVEYNNGVFVPFINNNKQGKGSITFVQENIGELKSNPDVSDNYRDIKNSVYNPNAALERKIQILSISVMPPTNK